MPRAPFNVIVIPFRQIADDVYEFAVFKRADEDYWQFIAGGGEDDELPIVAAIREAYEEGAVPVNSQYYELSSVSPVPAYHFPEARKLWDKKTYLVPNYPFAVEAGEIDIVISKEHTQFKWVQYDECAELLHWDSNVTALWELSQRLKNNDMLPFN
jgi:dATP pyrophosphohydrolase